MSRICEIYGTKPVSGHNVSHSKRRTKRTWQPNLQKKKYDLPELRKTVTLTLSTKAIKTISKYGSLAEVLSKAKDEKLSPKLLKIKNDLKKAKVKKAKPATAKA